MRLYHFTCYHAADRIGRRGWLRPWANPMWPTVPPLVWLTDLERPERLAVGLTSDILKCDRMEVRYATTQSCEPWRAFIERVAAARSMRQLHYPGTQPEHWFVSTVDVRVKRA